MRDWVVVVGLACFLSILTLCGDFLLLSFLTPDSSGYWFYKFLFCLGVALVCFGCSLVLFKKYILSPFVDVANKLGAASDLGKIKGALLQHWRSFLLDFYNAIENRTLKAVEMKRELLGMRSKHDSILDAQAELVFGIDEWGYITYSNKAFRTFMQLEEGCLDKSFLQSDYDIDAKISMILDSCEKNCLNEARKSPAGYHFLGLLSVESDRRYVEWVIKYVSSESADKSEEGYLFVGRDVTNEYMANKKSQRLESLAAIGKIAHFISHEINQPVSTIRLANANLELLLEQQCKGCYRSELIAPKVNKIALQAERIESIVASLKVFGRSQEEFVGFDIYAALDPVLDGFELLGVDYLDVCLERVDSLVTVVGAELLFQQVVKNIINNAIYAVKQSLVAAPRISIASEVNPLKETIVLRISDNGGGCPPEELSLLPDIFYTTKELGEGSGIGLALCLTVVEKMGGELSLSNISDGFEVTLRFPARFDERGRHSE